MKSVWINEKYKKRTYFGTTARFSAPKITYLEQVFLLIGTKPNGQSHVVTFESWQAAVKAGWIHVK